MVTFPDTLPERSQKFFNEINGKAMAEREGFEPPMELPPCRISSAVLSTTQPPLRMQDRL
jgi:hypothetical protein